MNGMEYGISKNEPLSSTRMRIGGKTVHVYSRTTFCRGDNLETIIQSFSWFEGALRPWDISRQIPVARVEEGRQPDTSILVNWKA